MARDMPAVPVGSSPGERPDPAGQSAVDHAGAGQPRGVAEALPAVATAEDPQPSPKPGKPGSF